MGNNTNKVVHSADDQVNLNDVNVDSGNQFLNSSQFEKQLAKVLKHVAQLEDNDGSQPEEFDLEKIELTENIYKMVKSVFYSK